MNQNHRPIDETIARSLKNDSADPGKVMPLNQAVTQFVQPGMKLHLAGGLGGPSAAICEIMRQYWGRKPDFELIQCILAGHIMNLIHGKLSAKLVFTVCAGSGKSRKEIQKAFAEKSIAFENWSLFTLQQRLMAGAFGVPFMPTRSIMGSSMASENQDSYQEVDDPFGDSGVGVVKALNPDISLVHGCVADIHGNTILPAPYSDDVWGPLASNNGVVVTVEKIVSTDVIRKHAALVKIPAQIVSAVCVAPLGLHPFSIANPGIDQFDTYGGDNEFMTALIRSTIEGGESLDNWIQEWILDCPTHEAYLKKLGGGRINDLRGQTTTGNSDFQLAFPSPPPDAEDAQYTTDELTPIVAAREIIKSVLHNDHRTMLAGAGAGLLASWLAYFQLRAQGYEIALIQGNGQIDYLPQPAPSQLRSSAIIPSARMMCDVITTQGVFVGGRHNRCISLLGAGEIDRRGNINSTLTAKGLFLSGSGGGNDATNAREVIIVLEQSQRRFVEKLAFVTCPGKRVSKVVSTMGVFEKNREEEELYLKACFPDPQKPDLEERIGHIRKNCGWPLKLADAMEDIVPPSAAELQLLRSLLPAAMV